MTFQSCPFVCAMELAFLNEISNRTRSSQQGWWKICVGCIQRGVLGTANLMSQNTEFGRLSSHFSLLFSPLVLLHSGVTFPRSPTWMAVVLST